MVDVRYILTDKGMRYDIYSPAKNISLHLLLPKGKECARLMVNSREEEFKINKIRASEYVDFEIKDNQNEKISVEIIFK